MYNESLYDRRLVLTPPGRLPAPSITVQGDAVDGFGVGMFVGALLTIGFLSMIAKER
jgi:hypothetical protein